jgi:hypothetical protein
MPTDKSQINTWFSRLPQTAYGIARAAGADWRNVISNSQETFEGIGAPEFADDAGYDNGSDIASDIWAVKNNTAVNMPIDFNFQDIGFHLYDALGGYSVSGAGPYTHVFSPQNEDTSRQLPVRTVLKKYGGLETLLMRDAALTKLGIQGATDNKLKVTSERTGSGFYESNPAGYNRPSIETDRIYAFAQQARFFLDVAADGTAQVETATIAVTTVTAGTLLVTVTSALLYGSPILISVDLAGGETAAQVAALVRAALGVNAEINKHYIVGGSGATYSLTARIKASDDTTLNMGHAVGTAGGVTTAASSANTTPGVVGDTQSYSCKLRSWNLSLENPSQTDGYTPCSRYLVENEPNSGAVRSEYLFGARNYMFNFDIWKESGDKLRGWIQERQKLRLLLDIVGTQVMSAYPTTFPSLRLEHTNSRIMAAPDSIVDPNIGISGQVKMLSEDGAIPLTITLINDVASYAS